MKFIYYGLIGILLIGCAQNASIEIGFNDGALMTGTFGDICIRVLKIEISQINEYTTIWENGSIVVVPINSEDYCSITNNYIPITPGTYKRVRITIDSLSYKIDNSNILLLDSVYQFIATAFSNIIVEDNDEHKLVINIASANWFDSESLKIKTGHQPFEGANLKIYY